MWNSSWYDKINDLKVLKTSRTCVVFVRRVGWWEENMEAKVLEKVPALLGNLGPLRQSKKCEFGDWDRWMMGGCMT